MSIGSARLYWLKKCVGVTIDTLCPLCDQPLGPRRPEYFKGLQTTSFDELPAMYVDIWPRTDPCSRPTNIFGRSIRSDDESLRDEICALHQYEFGVLPLALHFRWPRRFDPNSFLDRLAEVNVWAHLKEVYMEPSSSIVMRGSLEGKTTESLRSIRSHTTLRSLIGRSGVSPECAA